MMTVNRFLIWYHCVFLAVSQCSMILNDEALSISADRIGINTNILLYPHHQTIASSSASFPSETRICDVIKATMEDLMNFDKPYDVLAHFMYYVIILSTTDYSQMGTSNTCLINNRCRNIPPLTRAPIIFVLGGPGCGKGTQCNLLHHDFGFTHLSAGELLREEAKTDTDHGREILTAMKRGAIVPAKWTIDLLVKAIQNKQNPKGYLIDGFPRNIKHGPIFEEQVGKSCDLVLILECSEETMVNRILKRASTSGREDDDEDILKMRFQVFHKETKPVIDFYDSLGKVVRVNSENDINEVYEEVKNKLASHL